MKKSRLRRLLNETESDLEAANAEIERLKSCPFGRWFAECFMRPIEFYDGGSGDMQPPPTPTGPTMAEKLANLVLDPRRLRPLVENRFLTWEDARFVCWLRTGRNLPDTFDDFLASYDDAVAAWYEAHPEDMPEPESAKETESAADEAEFAPRIRLDTKEDDGAKTADSPAEPSSSWIDWLMAVFDNSPPMPESLRRHVNRRRPMNSKPPCDGDRPERPCSGTGEAMRVTVSGLGICPDCGETFLHRNMSAVPVHDPKGAT